MLCSTIVNLRRHSTARGRQVRDGSCECHFWRASTGSILEHKGTGLTNRNLTPTRLLRMSAETCAGTSSRSCRSRHKHSLRVFRVWVPHVYAHFHAIRQATHWGRSLSSSSRQSGGRRRPSFAAWHVRPSAPLTTMADAADCAQPEHNGEQPRPS